MSSSFSYKTSLFSAVFISNPGSFNLRVKCLFLNIVKINPQKMHYSITHSETNHCPGLWLVINTEFSTIYVWLKKKKHNCPQISKLMFLWPLLVPNVWHHFRHSGTCVLFTIISCFEYICLYLQSRTRLKRLRSSSSIPT